MAKQHNKKRPQQSGTSPSSPAKTRLSSAQHDSEQKKQTATHPSDMIADHRSLEQTLKNHLQKLADANDTLRMVNLFAEGLLRGDSMEKSLEFLLTTSKKLVQAAVGSTGIHLASADGGIHIHDTDSSQCRVKSNVDVGDNCPQLMENLPRGITINNDMDGRKFPPGHVPIRNFLGLGIEVKGGQAYLVLANKDSGFTEDDGRKIDIFGRLMSITIERWQVDEELKSHRAHLEELVTTRTSELRWANQRLKQEISERRSTEEKLVIYQEHLRSLASELSLTEERERRQIATGLHDHIGQNLALAKIKLMDLKEKTTTPQVTKALDEIHQLIENSIQQIRTLTFELSPPILYECGFEAAVEWLADQIRRQHGFQTRFENDNTPKPLENDIRVVLFQAVRELMFNIVKHARCTHIGVQLRRNEDRIHVRVEDNGVGFAAAKVFPHAGRKTIAGGACGFGLFNIRERLAHLGGCLEIDSTPGQGTRVILTAPVKKGN